MASLQVLKRTDSRVGIALKSAFNLLFRGEMFMTNYELMNKIIYCKSKRDIIRLINKYRISVSKSKYC